MSPTDLPGEFPSLRVHTLDERPVAAEGPWVLYWMIANRRMRWNFSLERAVQWATALGKPLVILEALRGLPVGQRPPASLRD